MYSISLLSTLYIEDKNVKRINSLGFDRIGGFLAFDYGNNWSFKICSKKIKILMFPHHMLWRSRFYPFIHFRTVTCVYPSYIRLWTTLSPASCRVNDGTRHRVYELYYSVLSVYLMNLILPGTIFKNDGLVS